MSFKKPTVNTIKADIKNVSIYLRSTKKWGKSTLFRDVVIEKYGDPDEAKIIWKAKEPIVCNDSEKAEKITKLIDKLEDDDDVQEVYCNVEFADEIMEE
jgi:transcriptional/translational regulatory protein YebC/TACO1